MNFRFNTDVVEVSKKDQVWKVKSESSDGQESFEESYDAVVVANGHTSLPFIPDTDGLAEWNQLAPGSVTHAKYYLNTEPYRGETVLIVGNYASGVDLATQIGVTAEKVYVSVKDESLLIEVDEPHIEYLKLVTRYDYNDRRSMHTIDGRKVSGIDKIIFCTGYLYSYPFLKNYMPEVTDGQWVPNLYRQIFNVEDPTLSFIELPKFIVPMPLSESQSAVMARVYSGRMQLPSVEERRKSYEEELKTRGPGKSFHALKPPADYEYCNELHDWIVREGLDDAGLVPIYWGEEKIKDRTKAKEIKDARYLDVVEHARHLRSQGKEYTLPGRASPVEY